MKILAAFLLGMLVAGPLVMAALARSERWDPEPAPEPAKPKRKHRRTRTAPAVSEG